MTDAQLFIGGQHIKLDGGLSCLVSFDACAPP